MSLEAIVWNNGILKILDQLLLPIQSEYVLVPNTNKGWEVINRMQVRGAPAIAIVGCLSLASEIYAWNINNFKSIKEIHQEITNKLAYLETARPTAINMKNASRELTIYSEELVKENISLTEYKQKIINWCVDMLNKDISQNKDLSEYGARIIIKNAKTDARLKVITHCNTGSLATAGYGTALGVIRRLFEINKIETRPYNQGARLTAYELVHENIPATLICDNMAGALMKIKGIDAIAVGADRIARNGDTANKIGTYQLAILAKHHRIPFYICAPTTTIDFSIQSGLDIPIEERPPDELTLIDGKRIAAPGIECWNPAFDVTPAELITGIITEKGVFEPQDLYSGLLSFMDLK